MNPGILIPRMDTQLQALLRYYTCGALVDQLAKLQAQYGNTECAKVLHDILEDHEGVPLVKHEPAKPLADVYRSIQAAIAVELARDEKAFRDGDSID